MAHNSGYRSEPLVGSEREISMCGISKSSVWMAAALVFLCGLLLLLPTEASAQFNIDGIIRGALQHGYNGGYGTRSTRHAKSHAKRDNDDDSASDKGKEKDATQEGSTNNSSSTHPQPPGPAAHDSARSVETDAPATRSAGANKAYDDQPAFSPAR